MATTIPAANVPVTCLFYYRQSIGDSWTAHRSVDVDQVRFTIAPQIPEARFSLKYGAIWEVGPAGAGQYTVEPMDLQGKQIRIKLSEASSGDIYWFGYCPSAEEEILKQGISPIGGDTVSSGDVTFVAYGLEYYLKTTILDRSYVESAGALSILNRVLSFNHTGRSRNAALIGNRSSAMVGDVYGFHETETNTWTAKTVLEYLLHVFYLQTGIPFVLASSGSQHAELDNISEAWTNLDGLSFYEILTRIIKPSRGFTFYFAGLTMHVVSVVDAAVGSYVPANPNVVSLTVDQSDTMGKARIKHLENVHFDEIVVRGERLRVAFTMSVAEGTLGQGWSSVEELAYEVADDDDRAKDVHSKVYCRLVLPADWDGKHGATGTTVLPAIDESTGTPDWTTVAPFFARDLVLDRTLPLQDPATKNPRPPLVVFLDDDGSYYRVHNPNSDDYKGCAVRMLDDGLGIMLSPKIPHYFGKDVFTESSEFEAVVDWRKISATVSLFTDERIRVRVTSATSEPGSISRVKYIDVPGAHYWAVAQGTVTDVATDGITQASAVEVVRDDTAILRRIADMAGAWYGRPRAEIAVKYRELKMVDRLGHVILETYSGGVTTPAGTIISEVMYDFTDLSVSFRTEWKDISLGQLLKPSDGLTPAIERRIRQVEDQLANTPVLVGGGGGGGGGIVAVLITSGTGENHIGIVFANGKHKTYTEWLVRIKVLQIAATSSIPANTWLPAWPQTWDSVDAPGTDATYWTVDVARIYG